MPPVRKKAGGWSAGTRRGAPFGRTSGPNYGAWIASDDWVRAMEALGRSVGAEFDVRTATAGGGVREVLRRRSIGPASDVVHAWGERALAAAVLRGGGRIVFSPTRFPSSRLARWLRSRRRSWQKRLLKRQLRRK